MPMSERCPQRRRRRKVCMLLHALLVVSIACAFPFRDSTPPGVAAFSLASIFPRRTQQQQKKSNGNQEVLVTTSPTTATQDILRQQPQQQQELRSNVYITESSSAMPMPMDNLPTQHHHSHEPAETTNGCNGDSNHHGEEEQSVHLQLQMMHQPTRTTRSSSSSLLLEEEEDTTMAEEEEEAAQQQIMQQQQLKSTRVVVHTYVDPATQQSWVGLNTSRRKFVAFLEYNHMTLENPRAQIVTTNVLLADGNHPSEEGDCRQFWRRLWKERRLITDRTELLAVYQSDADDDLDGTDTATTTEANGIASNNSRQQQHKKRGGFRDLLDLYANRLVAILQDELHDERTPPDARYRSSLVRAKQRNRYGQPQDPSSDEQSDHRILVKWLEDHYGVSETLMLQASRFHTLPVPAQLELMHHFLQWFRNHFPYYYDRCDACGASQKDDLANHQHLDEEEDDDDDDDQSTFLGYIYTDEYEAVGKASRTELYHCHKCRSFTRFPRYNSAFDIIQSQRGRCGEYSLLLYRFLRALNHDARWVVDWADHVWAEVLIGDSKDHRWVHLDPCEAAVDKPLLYEEWGKKQTYIVALYAPLRYQAMQQLQNRGGGFLGNLRVLNGFRDHHNGDNNSYHNSVDAKACLVEDVTQLYTTDSWEDICKRREETHEEVQSAIHDAIQDLERKLFR
ncbi:(N-acetyl-beta-glucosaminyl)asparagine amidase [Seminavis robusta]|uniref:(N-acetyl-beta-glucosaminyl)asparagine amidase n=1 Tax=Seminavis robusta TaxID=568900 RepID=A0A9N8F0M0_9STRA|nr:(N-acetyl-beta-glucosaminyl)asparagine amidase [Seminavis robusta]|eukprot:Sro2848_g338500.1 (N-acetyl-beta-glucosaminyl)asparagine amidase (678) ;mRNA; f:4792-6825